MYTMVCNRFACAFSCVFLRDFTSVCKNVRVFVRLYVFREVARMLARSHVFEIMCACEIMRVLVSCTRVREIACILMRLHVLVAACFLHFGCGCSSDCTLRCLKSVFPPLINFVRPPRPYEGPPLINFEENEAFTKSLLHFPSLLVLFRPTVKAKLCSSVCILVFCFMTTCFCFQRSFIIIVRHFSDSDSPLLIKVQSFFRPPPAY